MKYLTAFACLISLLLSAPAEAASQQPVELKATPAPGAKLWTIDHPKSFVQFRGFKDGKPFAVNFSTWNADIAFDPASPQTSTATVTVDTRSGSKGEATFREYLVAPAWYNPNIMPYAQFHATSFTKASGDIYYAKGVLHLYNAAKTTVFPVPGLSIPVQITIIGSKGDFRSNFSFAIPDLSPLATSKKRALKKVNFNMVLKAQRPK